MQNILFNIKANANGCFVFEHVIGIVCINRYLQRKRSLNLLITKCVQDSTYSFSYENLVMQTFIRSTVHN